MKRQALSGIRILIPAVFALLLSSSTAFAQTGSAVEVFGGYFAGYSSANGFTVNHDPTLGLRASHRLTQNFAVEAAATRTSDFFIAWNYELSAKAYLLQRDHFGLFVLAGGGDERVSFEGSHSNVKTLHAAIGAEIPLSERTYLRPEIRSRWPTPSLSSADRTTDYTIGFGWRF
jgi:hypothetical protein